MQCLRGRCERQQEKEKGNMKERKRDAQVVANMTRMNNNGERVAWDTTNRRRTTRLSYVGGAVIQPNAQVCRRLAGASLECKPLSSPFSPVSRAIGPDPSTLPPSCVPTPNSSLSANPYGPHSIATLLSTTTIANYGTQAQVQTYGRVYMTFMYGKCVSTSTTLRHVLSRQSVQLATNAFPRGQTDQAS